jgi:hypothetical protein
MDSPAAREITRPAERLRLVELTHHDYMPAMNLRRRWSALSQVPAVRSALVVLGMLLIAITPLVGPIPGPGGIIVFGAGLTLVLKYSGWAKRLYVRLKRKHPKKGAWADWSLRRRSAMRRHALLKERQGAEEAAGLEKQGAAPDTADAAPSIERAQR